MIIKCRNCGLDNVIDFHKSVCDECGDELYLEDVQEQKVVFRPQEIKYYVRPPKKYYGIYDKLQHVRFIAYAGYHKNVKCSYIFSVKLTDFLVIEFRHKVIIYKYRAASQYFNKYMMATDKREFEDYIEPYGIFGEYSDIDGSILIYTHRRIK